MNEFRNVSREELELIIDSLEHENKNFLKSAHSLWVRFKNYENNPPLAYFEDGVLSSICFITKLKRSNKINLYDIVSFKKGSGLKIWEYFIKYYYDIGVREIKFRALYSAIGFYNKLGIYYWGFDGKSFTVEQPLFRTIEEFLHWENTFKQSPILKNKKLLEDKEPPKKLKEKIDLIKKVLGKSYYLNETHNEINDLMEL